MFIGRKKELEALNRQYASNSFELAILQGPRRVGKTALINQLIQDKKAIYFAGLESNAKANLEQLSKSILEYQTGLAADHSFSSFQAALEHVFKLSEQKRLILVLDDYPYLARAEKSLAFILAQLIEKYGSSSRLMLILCGSNLSDIEDPLSAVKALLSGHITQIELVPFTFEEACQFLKNFPGEEKALLYGMAGGIPDYLLQINDKISAEENIKTLFLNPASKLFEEPQHLLREVMREPALYNAILAAIASGCSRMSEISRRVEEDTNVCSIYIKKLVSPGIVQKELPYGEKSLRKARYSIKGHLFRFWYRFIPQNASLISRGLTDLACRRIEPFLFDYMEKVFQEICRQYLWKLRLEGKCEVAFSSLGSWWGKDPRDQSEVEIDLLASRDKTGALFAMCQWASEKMDLEVLEKLIRSSELFSYQQKYFYLFSRSGFTRECLDRAGKMDNVTLVSYEEMISIM